jgi:hypothetical protein
VTSDSLAYKTGPGKRQMSRERIRIAAKKLKKHKKSGFAQKITKFAKGETRSEFWPDSAIVPSLIFARFVPSAFAKPAARQVFAAILSLRVLRVFVVISVFIGW